MKTSHFRILGILVVALCAGCSTNPVAQRMRVAVHTEFREQQSSQLTPEQEELLAELCPFGQPTAQLGAELGFTELVVREGYALEHSGDLKIPLWVCERMDPSKLNGPFDRKDDFRVDPDLEGPRSELSDYKGSGFARGHHAPAEDFSRSKERMSESFFLSNMSPQVSAVNSGAWAKLEKRARKWVAEDEVTWIITGALLYDPAEDDPSTANGWVEYSTIGAGVAVPTHLFKIVVGQDSDGNRAATAYVVPNEKLPAGYRIDTYRRSVRWIEERSGFDFMPELEPGEAEDLEAVLGDPRSL
jgi:endonuclease G